MKLTELLDQHEDFVRKALEHQKEIHPMVIFCKNKEITAGVVEGGREVIKVVLETASRTNPEWLVFLTESYSKEAKKEEMPNYRPGELQEGFEAGDKTIREIITLQAYSPEGKLMRVIDKKTLKREGKDWENFDGFLSVNDAERVFWRKRL